MIVALLFASMVYDLTYFFISDELSEDESGGVEANIKSFSKKAAFISFFFRIPLILILHKASLDFLAIVKGKNTGEKDILSLEEQVKQIIEDHNFDGDFEQ